jgi:hypothetical protein
MKAKQILTVLLIALLIASIFAVIKYIPIWLRTCSFDPDSFTPAGLPFQTPFRFFTLVNATEFVQPDDPSIQKTLREILERKSLFESDLQAIRNWVAINTKYKFDVFNWQEALQRNLNPLDYWQYPEETIKSKSGDCEDFAILLCSLLRASGYSPNEVYVVLGKSNQGGHSFVALKENGEWRYIEPQAREGWFGYQAWSADQRLNNFKIRYIFNDQGFYIPKTYKPPVKKEAPMPAPIAPCGRFCQLLDSILWAIERYGTSCCGMSL